MIHRLRNSTKRSHRMRRGSAVVECALVSPILVMLVLGLLDVGQFINVSQVVDNASREGARSASDVETATVGQIQSKVQQYLENSFPYLGSEEIAQATVVTVRDGNGDQTPLESMVSIQSGDKISVEVTFQYESVRWIHGFPSLNGKSIGTTAFMRRE